MRDNHLPGGPLPPNPLDDPENVRRIAALEAEIEGLGREQTEVEAQGRELLCREIAGEGFFAEEIHRLKQRKMVLICEIQTRRARINQIKLGFI